MPETLTTAKTPRVGGVSGSFAARVNRIEFGEGYSQRSKLGPVAETYRLTWEGVPQAEADALRAFLEARGGSEAFYYTLPNRSSAQLFTCAEWSEEWIARDAATVTASFVLEQDIVA